MRVIVSGGGSAGDISPLLATVDALRSLDSELELLYVGQAGGMEAKIAAASKLSFAAIPAGKFRRLHGAGRARQIFNLSTLGPNLRDVGRVVRGLWTAWRLVRRWQPDVILVKGGGVGLPVGLAARLARVPLVIHESNLVPGLGNGTLARWATKIAVGFPEKNYKDFDKSKLVFTGNPARAQLTKAHRLEGLAKFGFVEELPVVFVTGGSQGAASINDATVGALPELLEFAQVIHQTGERDLPRVQFELGRAGALKHPERYKAFAFILDDMPLALAAADVLVGRAGAGTIAEAALLSKPTVLIPNIHMAGHQVENAKLLARQGAVRIITEQRLGAASLVGEIRRILESREEQEHLSAAIGKLARPDAARELAQLVIDVGRGAA